MAKKKENQPVKSKAEKAIVCMLTGQDVIAENTDDARALYVHSRFGEQTEGGQIVLSMLEALYLLEKGRISISEKKPSTFNDLLKKAKSSEKNIWTKYCVFKDLRNRGYIVKTALKFGAEFRVYDRGVKPGEDHAKWIVYPVHESNTMTWFEFSAKNRVAHSTKKRLLLAVVDSECEVSYWETRWMRP